MSQKVKLFPYFIIVCDDVTEAKVVVNHYNVGFNTDDRDCCNKLTTYVLNEAPSHRWTLNKILLRYSIDSNAIKSSVVTK